MAQVASRMAQVQIFCGYLRHRKKISFLLSGYYYFIAVQVPSIFSHLRHSVPPSGCFLARDVDFPIPMPPKSCSVARQEMRGVTEEVVGSVTANSELFRTNYSGRV